MIPMHMAIFNRNFWSNSIYGSWPKSYSKIGIGPKTRSRYLYFSSWMCSKSGPLTKSKAKSKFFSRCWCGFGSALCFAPIYHSRHNLGDQS